MARDAVIEERVQRWAQWVAVGDGSGFPTMSVLHENWSPPSGSITPTLKVSAGSDVRQTHRAIAMLSVRLRNTLVVVYCFTLSKRDQAERLECDETTVTKRIDVAHRMLAQALDSGELCKFTSSG
mgnify:CR=1 FL=1